MVFWFQIIKKQEIMNVCQNWKGCFSNGQDFLKILFSNGIHDQEMIIVFFPFTDEQPPTFVCRFNSTMSPCPFKQKNQPMFSVAQSNYRENSKELCLQKVDVSAPNSTNSWIVAISEYKLKVDFFDQISPDDASNCTRRIVISSKADNKLQLEYCTKEGLVKKSVFERKSMWTDIDDVFKNLEDRRMNEEKAARVFTSFGKEMWLINDSILLHALMDVEEEIHKNDFLKNLKMKDESTVMS